MANYCLGFRDKEVRYFDILVHDVRKWSFLNINAYVGILDKAFLYSGGFFRRLLPRRDPFSLLE